MSSSGVNLPASMLKPSLCLSVPNHSVQLAGESLLENEAEASMCGRLDNAPSLIPLRGVRGALLLSLNGATDHKNTIVQWAAVDTFKGLLFAIGAMTSTQT